MKQFWILLVVAVLAIGGAVFYTHCHYRLESRWAMMKDYGGDRSFAPENGMFHSPMGGVFMGLRPDKGQREKLKQMVETMSDKMLPLKLEEQKKRIEISELIIQPNPNRDAISQKLQEMLKLKGEEQRLMLTAFFDINTVLNPAQKRIFSQFVVRRLVQGHSNFSSHESAK